MQSVKEPQHRSKAVHSMRTDFNLVIKLKQSQGACRNLLAPPRCISSYINH